MAQQTLSAIPFSGLTDSDPLGGDTGLIFVSRFSLRRTICVTLHLKWARLSLEESL